MNFPPENILPPCEWTSQTASSLLIVIMKSFYYNILPQHDTVWLLMGCTTWKWSINMRYGLPCRIKKSRNVRGPKRHKISYKKSVKLVMFSEFFCIVLQLNYNAMISVQDETMLKPSLSNWTKCECSLKLSVYPLCCLLAEPNMHLLVTKHCGCVLFRVPIWWCIKSIIFLFLFPFTMPRYDLVVLLFINHSPFTPWHSTNELVSLIEHLHTVTFQDKELQPAEK